MNSRTSHNKKCSPNKGKSFNCFECPYVVDRQDRLKLHIEKKHCTPSIQKFECTFCKVELSSAFNLKVHEKMHVPPSAVSSPELQCNICTSTFASKKSLYVHNHKFHSNTKVANGLGFGVFEDGKVSIKKAKDKFQCEKCGYSTKRSHNLKIHLEKKFSCTTRNSFRCKSCDYVTKKKSHFKEHSKTVHTKSWSNKQKIRQLNKLKGGLGIEEKVFDENDMIKMIK